MNFLEGERVRAIRCPRTRSATSRARDGGFWEQGYEGAGLADLTAAMGITRTSMYAALGNKENLFRKALERYSAGPAGSVMRALEKPTAREVAAAFLHGGVDTTTSPDRPHGCLTVWGALATAPADRAIRDALSGWRNNACAHLHDRFRRAKDEGNCRRRPTRHYSPGSS